MGSEYLPITTHTTDEAVVAIWQGREIRYDEFLSHCYHLAARLPEKQFAINLCEDRYLFLVSFFAVNLKNQTNLLPASKLPALIEEMKTDYTGSYTLADNQDTSCDFLLSAEEIGTVITIHHEPVSIKAEHAAAVVFTSGSTGKSKPNIKSWSSLYTEATLATERFNLVKNPLKAIIATVPPQHMYGLMTSIILPMLSATPIVCAPTLYPADIEQAINSAAGECVLITTPIHLRACVGADENWHSIRFVVSATAKMPVDLARKVEQHLKTSLYEIYGASEYGSVATRRTVNETKWTLYDGMMLVTKNDGVYFSGPQFKNDIVVHDVIEVLDDSHFMLVGRDSDLLKIAGKRVSLTDLNQKLCDIEGVIDGVFFAPRENGNVNARLTAFVVAPGLSRQQLLTALKKDIEPAFLPRPLIMVKELPRNATGKLPHRELETLLESFG